MVGTYIIHDGKIPFYVGKGDKKRSRSHLKTSHSAQVNRKIAKMRREGREPDVQFIPAPDDEHAKEMECLLIAMIGRRDLGLGPLLNGTNGGEGVVSISDASRAKLSAWHKSFRSTEEGKAHTKRAVAEAQRPDVKRARAQALKETFAKPEVKAKRSKAQKEAQNRPEIKERRSFRASKPCTVDGITIYPSLKALVAELGQGIAGRNHPNFRYVPAVDAK